MVDIKEGGLDNQAKEQAKPQEKLPVEIQFREKRQAMRDKAAGIQKRFQEIEASAPGNVDLTEERDELAGLQLRLTHNSEKAQSELDEREIPKLEQTNEELTGEVSTYVQELVDSSREIGQIKPGESKPVTRKTEYLRRPGEKDANAIQVQIALGENGGKVMRIENYALGTDARGHIAELKTLIIGEDGKARVLHADRYGTYRKRKGIWSSQTTEADAADIQEAYDAMRRLRGEEEARAKEGTNQAKEEADQVRKGANQSQERADLARERETARIQEEVFGTDRLRDSQENPATDADRTALLTAIRDMADNREGSGNSINVRPDVGETVRYLDRYDTQGNLLPWQDGLIVVSHPEQREGHAPTYEAVIKNVETNATKRNAPTEKESIAIERNGDVIVIREIDKENGTGRPERWAVSMPASRADVQKALEIMNTLYTNEQSRLEEARLAVEALDVDKAILPDVSAQNIDLLSNAGEVGQSLIPYYEYALRLVPSLATVRINRNDNVMPHARGSFEDGLHNIEIPLGTTSPNILLDKLMASGTFDYLAESLDMQPEELAQRPDLLLIHAAMHELGHTVQFQQYDSNPEAFNKQYLKEKAELPIPGWDNISSLRDTLKDENSNLSIWVRDNWEALQARYQVKNVAELIKVQSIAKRKIFNELYADTFAAMVIKGIKEEKIGEQELIAS